jgi:hypothetical protein
MIMDRSRKCATNGAEQTVVCLGNQYSIVTHTKESMQEGETRGLRVHKIENSFISATMEIG